MSTFAAFWHRMVSLVPGAHPVLGKGWVQPENRITREVARRPGTSRRAGPAEATEAAKPAPEKPSRPGQAA
jgi:hypothetical protein